MPFAALPPPAAATVWLSQPSPDDIARAEGFYASTNAVTSKASMTCYVLADGRLDACKVDPSASDRWFADALLALKGKYRLDTAASPPQAQVTVGVTFPKLEDIDQELLARPSTEEVRAAMPGAEDVTVALRCTITVSGALKNCEADPDKGDERFATAALGLAARFRFKPLTLQGRPTEGYATVRVRTNPHLVVDPDWLNKPNGDSLASVYPKVAIASGLGGHVRMRCLVTAEGLLRDCRIITETPPGVGFGDALLKLAPTFRMKPKTRDGVPVADGEVVIPVNFIAPAGVPAVASGTPGSFKILSWAPWSEAPTAADVAAVFPARARAAHAFGNAALRCELKRDGRLTDCESSLEGPDPMGFGRAATTLAPKFRAVLGDIKPWQLPGLRIAVPISFSERVLEPPETRHVHQIEWLRSPEAATMAGAYPDKAVKAGVLSGATVVDCRIGAAGQLEACAAKSQEPADLGFGAAGETIAGIMQANLWTGDGEAAPGQHVLLPLRFIYSAPPVAAAPPAAAKPPG